MTSYKELTARLPFDISAEALTGSLLENSPELADSGQILVRPLGHLSRAGGREVMQVSGPVFNAEGQELVYLDINREGLYDTLPEMLFLHLEAEYEDELEKARHLARQQENARRFLVPFEETFYRARIDLELSERSTIKTLAALLLRIYDLNNLEEAQAYPGQMHSLALTFPFLNQVVGDLEVTASLLSAILRRQVGILQTEPRQFAIPEAQQTRLGKGLLGIDMLLGNCFSDGIGSLQVTIGDVLPQEVKDWLPWGNQRRLLEEQLLPYVLAAGEQVELSIGINDAGGCFTLGNTDDNAFNILGYTTLIK